MKKDERRALRRKPDVFGGAAFRTQADDLSSPRLVPSDAQKSCHVRGDFRQFLHFRDELRQGFKMILVCPECNSDIAKIGTFTRRGYCERCGRWFSAASLFGKLGPAALKTSIDHRRLRIDRDQSGVVVTTCRRGVSADDLQLFFVIGLILAFISWFMFAAPATAIVFLPFFGLHVLMIAANLIGATERQRIDVSDRVLTLTREYFLHRSSTSVRLSDIDHVRIAFHLAMNPLQIAGRRMMRSDSQDVSHLWVPTIESNGRRLTFGEWLDGEEQQWLTAHLCDEMERTLRRKSVRKSDPCGVT